MIPNSFHFLRPEWLLALLPAALIVVLALHRIRHAQSEGWSGLVDAHLMRHLAVPGTARRGTRGWIAALAIALVASVLAMAGPTWEKLPTPVHGGSDPTVIVLSLAQSMNGTDLVPSRLIRAGHKLRDILDREKGSDVGLVIYADRPFVATPLTGDADVIRQMLPDLSTDLMPVLGNRLDLAINEAQGLLSSAGATTGRIVVIADDTGLDPAASVKAAETARHAGYNVSVLGVGTTEGADIQTADGRAITGKDGQPITARLDTAGLTKLATAGGGQFSPVTADESDITRLLPPRSDTSAAPGRASDMVTDSWHDAGYLLLLIPVLLAPFAFRRGLLFALPLMLLGVGMTTSGAQAEGWRDLVQTPDQRGQSAFDAGDYATATQDFHSTNHKAAAFYRDGDFEAAALLYGAPEGTSTSDSYNLGNALAKAGQLEKALAAYDQALDEIPTDADAKFNRDLVSKLLEQQKQEQKQKDEKTEDQNKNDQSQSGDSAEGEDQSNDKGQQEQQDPQSSDAADAQGGEAQQSDETGGQPGEANAALNEKGEPTDANDGTKPKDGTQPSDTPASDRQTDGGAAGQPGPDGADQGQTPQTHGDGTPGEPTAGDLKKRMDQALAGNRNTDTSTNEEPTAQETGPTLDQAAEQQLRAVPDDPSGLLRARIRQHYARLRAGGQ